MEPTTTENTQNDNIEADPVITRGDGSKRSVPKRAAEEIPEYKVIAQGIKRELPVKLTNEELLEVAFAKAGTEDELAQLEDQFADVKREWSERLGHVEKRIEGMGLELRTRERKQVVICHERVVAATRMVEVVREDTNEVVDRRAANLFEAGKILPNPKRNDDGPAEDPPEVDDALAAAANETMQAAAAVNVEEDADGDVVVPETSAPKKKRGKKS